MKPRILSGTHSISANCPNCKAVTSFEPKSSMPMADSHHSANGQWYGRTVYVMSQCAGCGLGGFARLSDGGHSAEPFLDDFYPFSIDSACLPNAVPEDIQAEFREAERCQALSMNRAASALFRSVLEKTLKANGYTKGSDPTLRDLQRRIDAAAADNVITEARRKRAHDEIRALGNDVLHDEWRPVTDEEVEDAHLYMQRILEDLYDDRPTVESILTTKGRLAASVPVPIPVRNSPSP